MSKADFAITADMAEISHVQYEIDYTMGISQQMMIPDRLKVGPDLPMDKCPPFLEESHSTIMQVPERIIVAGDDSDILFSRPREFDLLQSTPVKSMELKAPPRVLTLQDQPLDFLELEQQTEPVQPKQKIRSHTRSRREHCASETSRKRHNGQIVKYDAGSLSPSAPVRVCTPLGLPTDWPSVNTMGGVLSYVQLTTRRAYQHVLTILADSHHRTTHVGMETILEAVPDDVVLANVPALRRQIVKLNCRLQALENKSKERARREIAMYSITAAFCLLSMWTWVRH